MNQGFIKLARRTFGHYLWTEKRSLSKFEAWLDLLQLAAHLPTRRIIRGHVVEIGRGEIIASLRYLGERWNWKKDKVASFLGLIEQDQMIRRSTRHTETVVTICNYDRYNDPPDRKADSQPDTGPTAGRQPPDKDKNVKNVKNSTPPTPPGGGEPGTPDLPGLNGNAYALPFASAEFVKAWEAWKQHRKEIRKKLTDHSIKGQFRQMADWGEQQSIAAIWHSIANGWQGLFPPSQSEAKPAKPPTFDEVAAYAEESGMPTAYAESFYDWAKSNGWRNKTGPIHDWRAAFRLHCQIREIRYAAR